MKDVHLPLWNEWILKPHVSDVWFLEGYEPVSKIRSKIKGNGYDYAFVIYVDDTPIGFIQCCDLYAYKNTVNQPKGIFTDEPEGSYGMDLFIANKLYMNKGLGTQIVKQFLMYIFERFSINKLFIDPASSNKRAIRCYEKAGFIFLRNEHDGMTECHVMQLLSV